MAADLIPISSTKQRGVKTVRMANLIRELRELTDLLSDAKDHASNGADFSMLEAEFGLQAGAGANFATLLGQMQEILNTNVTVAGADRLARLDEFCARIAGQ